MENKKYIIYISAFIIIALVGLLFFQIYRNNKPKNPATQSQIEDLQKRIVELENGKNEQAIATESAINQIKEEQIKKLEDITSELRTNIKNSNTKQLEARMSTIEKNINNLNSFASKNSTTDSYLFGKAMDSIRN